MFWGNLIRGNFFHRIYANFFGDAGGRGDGVVERCPADFYFRDILFSFDSAAAAAAEEVDGDAGFAEDGRQDYDQRRVAGDDHGAQG